MSEGTIIGLVFGGCYLIAGIVFAICFIVVNKKR